MTRSAFIVCCMILVACSSKETASRSLLAARTNRPELLLVEEALEAYERGFFSVSRDKWGELLQTYPASPYGPLAALKTADSYFFAGNYTEALAGYEEFLRIYPIHEARAYVQFQIGESKFLSYKGENRDQSPIRSGLQAYRALLEEYPSSEYVPLARRRIQDCREAMAAYEVKVTQFYLKQDLFEAAAARYVALLEKYPASEALVQANREIQDTYPEDHQLLLALAEKQQLMTEPGTLPDAPILLAQAPVALKPTARFRLSVPETPQIVMSTHGTRKPAVKRQKQTIKDPVLKKLQCVEAEDGEHIMITFREHFGGTIETIENHGATTISLTKGATAPGDKTESSLIADACKLELAGHVQVEEFESMLTVNLDQNLPVEAILLDRPQRLLIVPLQDQRQ